MTSPNLLELAGGLLLSLLIGLAGYRRGALSESGVVGALITGTLIFGLGGWEWGLLLIAFFVSSSLLSFYRSADKEALAEKFAKGHRRDLGQALANGGLAALLAVCSFLRPHPIWFIACVGALATVNADTWATELGVLSRSLPRLITTGRQVEVGTSGGITWAGNGAALGGALLIGMLGGASLLVLGEGHHAAIALVAGTAGGIAGALTDSLLGATVQAIYWCDVCHKETERPRHRCGRQTRLYRGWRWLNNDLVNFLASVAGALVATTLGWVLG
ncbi:MAG: DUF92 domain-containing protein [Anaerolineae bacterium]|nr:DUF92 domain-containing protein [Anaerolineae bacterium]